MEFNHTPIMLEACIENLSIKPNGVYVDATLGGAGHSLEIAKRLDARGTLIGIDKDADAIKVGGERLKNTTCKVILANTDYKNFCEVLKANSVSKVDGILADLGVSSYQLDEVSRGFSYSKDAPLDMRMDQSQSLTAREVVNNYPEEKLVKILFDYGEESFAKKIASNIVRARSQSPIETTSQLVKIIEASVPSKLLHKGGSVAKKTFQAIRIEVNGELDSLKAVLNDFLEALNPGGRLCIITFHSLEDRIVKNCFNEHATGCVCPKDFPICVCGHKADVKIISKKPITPSEAEQKTNSRSTSSKLRVAEKL